MTVTAQVIKDLREATGAGMMDCKKALAETNGNVEEAKDWLRKKGIATAGKKAGRIAAEGLVGIAVEGNKAAIIELNSETDFVAKNEQFQQLAASISKQALAANGDFDKVKAASDAAVTEATATIGEKIELRRSASLSIDTGIITTYVHNSYAANLGKIGVLLALKSTGDKAKLEEVGKQVAMHIAAAKPTALTRDEVSADSIERERAIFIDQARASGKPDNIIEKMVDGRIAKFYSEVVLPEQIFVIDNKSKISEVLKAAEKEVGAPIEIAGFKLFILGEGIEKKEENFAEEVMKTASGA